MNIVIHMHIIICPNCGKKMKTKVLIRGTVRCPACQVRFNSTAPNDGGMVAAPSARDQDTAYIAVFTLFGLLCVFSFLATGGLWFIEEMSEDLFDNGWALLLSPFYLAQIFLALYFFMPLVFRMLGREPNSTTMPAVQSNSGGFNGWSPPPQPQETNHRRSVMGILGAIAIVFVIITLALVAFVILLFS